MKFSKRAKRRALALAAGSVVVAVAIGGIKMMREAQTYRLTEQKRADGLAAYQRGEFEEALGNLSYAVGRNKSDVELLLAFADTRSRLPQPNERHLTESIGLYNRVLQIDPGNRTALERLLVLHQTPGSVRLLELANTAKAVLKIEPTHVAALAALAQYHMSQQSYEEALATIEQLERYEPHAIEWRRLHLAVMMMRDNGLASVTEVCSAWIEQFPEADGRFALLKASALMRFGHFQEAAAAAEDAAARGASSPEVLRWLVQVLDELDRTERSDALLDEAKQVMSTEEWVWDEAIRRRWLLRDVDGAQAELTSAEDALGRLPISLLKWAVVVAAQTGSYEELDTQLDLIDDQVAHLRSDRRDQWRAWSAAIRAFRHVAVRPWADVEAAFDRAIAMNPKDGTLFLLRGWLLRDAHELDRAMEALEQICRLEPTCVISGVDLVDAYLRAGRTSEGLQTATRMVVRKRSPDPMAAFAFVRSWLAEAEASGTAEVPSRATGVSLGDIQSQLHAVVATAPQEALPGVVRLLFKSYALQHDIEAARELVARYEGRDDLSPQLLMVLARATAEFELGDLSLLLDRAARAHADPLDVAELRAWMAHRSGQSEKGLEIIDETASRIDRSDGAVAWRFDRLRTEYLVWSDDGSVIDEFRRLLDEHSGRSDSVPFVLSHSMAWTDASLIDQAIRIEKARFGQAPSTGLRLVEAMYGLRFQPHDDAARARSLSLVSDVLRETPSSLSALLLMSDALATGPYPDTAKAIEYLKRAVDTYPARLDLYPRLVSLCQSAGDFRTAEDYLARLGRRTDLDTRLQRSELTLLERQGDYETALLRLLARSPEDSTDTDQLAIAAMMLRTGRHDEAHAILKQQVSKSTPSEAAVMLSAKAFAATGDVDRGLELLRQNPSPRGEAADKRRTAQYLQKCGRHDEALHLLQELLSADGVEPATFEALSLLLMERDDVEAARRAAEQGLAIAPDHVGLRINFALASLNDASPATRNRAVSMVAVLAESHAPLVATIETYAALNLDAPTDTDFRAVDALAAAHPEFLPALGLAVEIHWEAGHFIKALDLAREAMARHPDEPAPAEWCTQILLTENRFDDALAMARLWRSRSMIDPLRPDFVIASILLALDRRQEAAGQIERHVDRIIIERDRWPDRVNVAMQSLISAGRTERAWDRFRAILSSEPKWQDTWIELAAMMDTASAGEMLRLIEINLPVDASDALRLAGAWSQLSRRSGEVEQAQHAEDLARQAEREPELAIDAQLLRGSLAELRGETKEAIALYHQVLQGRPTDPVALNNLAFLLSEQEETLEAALRYSQRVARAYPAVAAFLDTHASVLLKLGQWEEAERFVKRAVDLQEDAPEFRVTLAAVYIGQRRFDEAEMELQRASSLLLSPTMADKDISERIGLLNRQLQELQSVTIVND